MKCSILLSLALVVCFSLSTPASAAVIERDWKSPGDGLLTYDTINKREWLDLSQSILDDRFPGTGANFLEVRESRYQYVVGQTGPGGLFEGFTVAKSPDVIALAQSAGIDTTTPEYDVNAVPTLVVGSLLGFTFESDSGLLAWAMGLLDEMGTNPFAEYRLDARFEVHSFQSAGLFLSVAHTQVMQFPPGIMLYRAIPEPAASIVFFSGLAAINAFWRRINRYVG